MSYRCSACSALMFKDEVHKGKLENAKFALCCSYGKISLPDITSPPEDLKHLLEDNDSVSKAFRTNIRTYNSALALSSIGVDMGAVFKFDNRGPWIYKITGQVYHSLGPLMPMKNTAPSFSQLYVYDCENELQNRMQRNPEMNENCLASLQALMHQYNPFVKQYKQVYEFYNIIHLV